MRVPTVMRKAARIETRLAMLAALSAGCAPPAAVPPGDAAPAAVSGDALPAAGTSAARVTLTAPVGATPRLDAVLDDGAAARRVTTGDLRATADVPAPHTAWLATASRGTLRVRVTLGGAAGALGADSLALPLAPGWLWSVEALVHRPAPGIPAPPCFGCAAETRTPLRADASRGIAAGDVLLLRAARVPAPGQAPLPPT